MQNIRDLVKDDFDAVNGLIIEQLSSDVDLVESIGQYLINAGGKRLRPLMSLLCYRALEASSTKTSCFDQQIQFATVIEFIHSATLLHDDVVDMSSLRRGMPTANAQWGNAPSVLVGDFIYSRAFQLLVKIGNLDIMSLMADTTNEIAEGEVLQLTKAGNPDTSEADYMEVIARKTAILFASAMEGAAKISGATAEQTEALKIYGHNIGVAFQLMDDVLDYEGDPEKMGKNIGDDLSEGKPTLPLIYSMANDNDDNAKIIRKAITEKSSQQLARIVDIVQQNGALDYTKQLAQALANEAKDQLSCLENSPFKAALETIANMTTQRDN